MEIISYLWTKYSCHLKLGTVFVSKPLSQGVFTNSGQISSFRSTLGHLSSIHRELETCLGWKNKSTYFDSQKWDMECHECQYNEKALFSWYRFKQICRCFSRWKGRYRPRVMAPSCARHTYTFPMTHCFIEFHNNRCQDTWFTEEEAISVKWDNEHQVKMGSELNLKGYPNPGALYLGI